MKGSRGTASMVSKCKFCSRESSMGMFVDLFIAESLILRILVVNNRKLIWCSFD